VVVTARGDSRGPRFAQAAPVTAQTKPLDDAARHNFEQMATWRRSIPLQRSGRCAAGTDRPATTLRWWERCRSRRAPVSLRRRTGKFFLLRSAEEAIILGDFGRDLLNLPRGAAWHRCEADRGTGRPVAREIYCAALSQARSRESAPLAGKSTKKGQADPDDGTAQTASRQKTRSHSTWCRSS